MESLHIALWLKLLIAAAVGMFAFCAVASTVRLVRRPSGVWRRRLAPGGRLDLALLVAFVVGFAHYAATKGTNGNDRVENGNSGSMAENVPPQGRDAPGEMTNLCFTGFAVSSNAAVIGLSWPTNFFEGGACLDFFAKVSSLTNGWTWIGCQSVAPGDTNMEVSVDLSGLLGCTNAPSAAFFRVLDRTASATTMGDWDGDGLPDVYEVANGTNPYVPDFASAPMLTVGPFGDFETVEDALAASTEYSIVALSAGEHFLAASLVMPDHPVLLTGPPGGYAVLHSEADVAVVKVVDGQDSETLFRNLYLVLERRGNFQSGFWIGGNLPWSGLAASPTFENVRVRAMYPETRYYGWHYYRDDGGVSVVSNCVMNAAGAEDATGVYSYGGPEVRVLDCHFVNFPTNAGSYATYFRSGTNIVSACAAPEPGLSWAGYPLDAAYDAAADSDGDGIFDRAEVIDYDTDPWLADSDGDGVPDADEVADGTDPRVLESFLRHVIVVTSAYDPLANTTNYVAWGTDAAGWVTNELYASASSPYTNAFVIANLDESVYVKAYRDINRNGIFDSGVEEMLSCALVGNFETLEFRFSEEDRDGDGIRDWWEAVHAGAGLSSTNSEDAYLDPDGDGLINLHEYWADCDPLAYDGTNTAIYAAVHSIDDRLTTASSAGRLNYYSSIGAYSVVVNTNCWAKDIDISCMSVLPAQKPTTLITRKHFISAKHHGPEVGDIRYFAGGDGMVHTATVSHVCYIGTTDITVGEFNQPLPESIVPAKILPMDYIIYLGSGRKVPVVHSDFEKKVAVADLVTLGGSHVGASVPDSEIRMAYYEPVIGGDSGHPRFLVMGNDVILIDCVEGGPNSPGHGPSVHFYRTDIQQAIESFGDTNTWTMTEFDFSSYNDLPNR